MLKVIFLDEELALQSGIPLERLESPRTARALNGKFLAQVTHCTVPITLVLSGNHGDSIEFKIISSPGAPLDLGHSSFCHLSCLRSALPPEVTVPPLTSESPDLSTIPEEYHDLSEVFRKDLALSLPPHHPYDCAIDLLPGAPLPTSRSTISPIQKEKLWRSI